MKSANKMPKNQFGLAPIPLIVLTAIFIGAVYFIYVIAPNMKNQPAATPMPVPSSELTTPKPIPNPTENDVVSPPPTFTPSVIQIKATAKPAPACVRVKTYGMFDNNPELEADKCYTPADADALDDLIRKYNNAIFNFNSAAGQANVTCQGFTESFKQQCEQSKADADKYKAEMDNYKAQIKAIISRGK